MVKFLIVVPFAPDPFKVIRFLPLTAGSLLSLFLMIVSFELSPTNVIDLSILNGSDNS